MHEITDTYREVYGPTAVLYCPECGERAGQVGIQRRYHINTVTVEVTCDRGGGLGCGHEFTETIGFSTGESEE